MTTCKNCTLSFEGKYCPECGQKASTKRFSTRILFSELIDKLLPVDRGILFTSWQLITRPGPMLREYLDGKRMKYTKPLQFLLVMIALSLIFFHQGDAFVRGIQDGMGEKSQAAIAQKINEWVSQNMTLLIAGMVPFTAWMARLIFRKRSLNFAEHTVSGAYLIAGSTLMGIPAMIVMNAMHWESTDPWAMALFFLIYFGYFLWGYIGLFPEYSPWNTGFKTLLAVLTGYLLYVLTMMIVVVLGIVLYYLVLGKP